MNSQIQSPPSDKPTIKIAQKVADVKGKDPMDLRPPLHDVIDTEALDRLFESAKDGPQEGKVTFEYNGCRVKVEADGTVEVERQNTS